MSRNWRRYLLVALAGLTRRWPESADHPLVPPARGRPRLALGALVAVALSVGAFGWARSPWAGVLPYRIGPPGRLAGGGPCSAVQGQVVVLRLRPGSCSSVTPPMPAPGDIPPGEIVLRLPRYPGAEPADRTMTPVLSIPLDGYLKMASAVFFVPAGDPAAIEDWYADRMGRLGYTAACCGSGVDTTGAITATVTTEQFSQGIGSRGLAVQIEGEQAGDRGAFLLIEAHAIAPPSRLAVQPRQWLGRTVRVRGIVGSFLCLAGCASLPPRPESVLRRELSPELEDVSAAGGSGPVSLPLLLEPRSPFLGWLSRLPGLGPLVPGWEVAWNTPAVYPLRIQPRTCIKGQEVCHEGVLDDAIPTAP